MKNHITKTGIELEGLWNERPTNFKEDGSVSFDDDGCDGDCRDNCECLDYCECDRCLVCNGCDDSIDNCDCSSCLYCEDCENEYESCECDRNYRHLKECDIVSCNNANVCDDCINNCEDEFDNNQNVGRNCQACQGISIQCDGDCGCECQCECNCVNGGELVSKPLNKNEIKGFIKDNYPDRVNSSCGMHVHLSFNDDKRDVHILATKEFNDYFVKSFEKWAIDRKLNNPSRFYHRLKGDQSYCKREFKGYSQLKNSDDRYTQINFCSYAKFNTVEFRLATMFDNNNISVEYVDKLHAIVNDYLSKNKPKVYEFNLKINKSTSIYLKLNMVKSGLRIFVKTFGIEDEVKNKDYSNYDKFSLYSNHREIFRLNTNLTSLIDVEDYTNYTFLRLKGSSNGKSMIIKGMFSKQDIEFYMTSLINGLPRLIRDIKGVKMICV